MCKLLRGVEGWPLDGVGGLGRGVEGCEGELCEGCGWELCEGCKGLWRGVEGIIRLSAKVLRPPDLPWRGLTPKMSALCLGFFWVFLGFLGFLLEICEEICFKVLKVLLHTVMLL